jgi:hypothetical protein
MIPTDARPSDIYSQTHRRLAAREADRIMALHRASYAAHQIIVAAERRNSTNELDIHL